MSRARFCRHQQRCATLPSVQAACVLSRQRSYRRTTILPSHPSTSVFVRGEDGKTSPERAARGRDTCSDPPEAWRSVNAIVRASKKSQGMDSPSMRMNQTQENLGRYVFGLARDTP